MITIDGTTAAGKCAVAKKLAEKLKIAYCDTGAMYRCVTYGLIHRHIKINHPDEVAAFLKDFTFEFKDEGGERHYFFDGQDVTKSIHLADVTFIITKVASIPAVREKLMSIQRAIASAANGDMIFTGRDMGTVIFPDAAVKVFMTGNPELRGKWRYRELTSKYPSEYAEMSYEDAYEEITERDEADMSRAIAPLKRTKDSLFINVSDLTIDEVVDTIIAYKNNK